MVDLLLSGALEVFVNSQSKEIVDHSWEQNSKNFGTLIEAGVCINFNQPSCEVVIDHKVVPEKFKAAIPLIWV